MALTHRVLAKYYKYIFSLYLALGPVYWMPWVGNRPFEAIKTAAYLTIVSVPVAVVLRSRRLSFPGGGLALFAVGGYLLSAFPGMLLGDPEESAYKLQNTLQIILFVHACGYVIGQPGVGRVVSRAVQLFVLFCGASLLFIAVVPNYTNPFNEALIVASTGLGGARTGWSPAVALYLPWIYTFSMNSAIGVGAAGLILLGNQLAVGSRTGLLSTAVPFIAYALRQKSAKSYLFLFICIALAVTLALNFSEELRLSQGGVGSFEDLNELSTGRVEQYVASIRYILDEPLFGRGFGEVVHEGRRLRTHNAVLMAATEGGLVHAAFVASILILPIIRGYRKLRMGSPGAMAAWLTVLSGVVASMFEPGFMFGSFNKACFWWLCFSLAVSTRGCQNVCMRDRY